MKKSALFIVGVLLSTTLAANPWSTTSLIGIEGGIGQIDADGEAHNLVSGGIKVGAQTERLRLFLSGKLYSIDGFESANAIGGELQYLLPLNETFKMFIGLNGGQMSLEVDTTEGIRKLQTPYFGGEAGINMALSDTVDVEIGGRIISLDYSHSLGNVTYSVNSIVQGYASIILKFPTR